MTIRIEDVGHEADVLAAVTRSVTFSGLDATSGRIEGKVAGEAIIPGGLAAGTADGVGA